MTPAASPPDDDDLDLDVEQADDFASGCLSALWIFTKIVFALIAFALLTAIVAIVALFMICTYG